jgi:hypothetical protein
MLKIRIKPIYKFASYGLVDETNNTVKPELTATSEQQPPINKGRYNLVTASIKLTFIKAPLSNSHFFQLPRVAVVHRFDCI